ncbi:4Fe-4S binding protein [Kiritimatiellaeota bacterium B1221]|nr:4Fe-4S binding protein [Kiritimatiellaeota bacterium B1221]
MSFIITDRCTACDACRVACPTQAVSKGSPIYKIDRDACNNCEGVMGGPRCMPICPESGAIIFQPEA